MMEILVVDDSRDYLGLLKDGLTIAGYNVHTAEDGMEGCEILASSNIDLVISDIRMPRLDGIKLHAFAREMDRFKKKKFIFISGYKDMYSTIPSLDPEIDYFLDKTTPLNAIIKLVDRLVFGKFANNWA
jgi:DNA-binding NtrC family response regulator